MARSETAIGLKLEGLSTGDVFRGGHLDGSVWIERSSSATVLLGFVLQGVLTLSGRSSAEERDAGFVGVLTMVGLDEPHDLIVNNSLSVVFGDFYSEETSRHILLRGDEEDAPGRVTISGIRAQPTTPWVLEASGYRGQLFWSGFGVTANATLVDSNAELNVENTSQTFALVGLGNTYNLIGFYDKGGFQARIAWNRRDRFLQTARGFGGEPTYVSEYDQVDIRFSYDLSQSVQIFLEGINITDEKTKKVGRYDNEILLYEETGPRYTLGVSATF